MAAVVDESVIAAVKLYLRAAQAESINARRAILFSSQARGEVHEWSDIDLIVISPDLEPPVSRKLIDAMWTLRARTDSRIEPIACGEKEWETDDERPIIEVAWVEGIPITLDD